MNGSDQQSRAVSDATAASGAAFGADTHTVYRSCTLCEAMCGLAVEVEGDRIRSVRPDVEDVFSKGFICPKAVAITDVHHDPDRLRTPVRRNGNDFQPISWEEGFELVAARLCQIRRRYGADAIAIYRGNQVIHNPGVLALQRGFCSAVRTRNIVGASSQDTSPRFATSFLLYGSSFVVPIPDVDRTQYFLCIGSNPLVSNGSVLTAPDMRARLRRIRERGGKVVVVDPRCTETARAADEHVPIRPGGDATFLLAMIHVLLGAGRIDRAQIERIAAGWEAIEPRLAAFTPARAAEHTGVPAETIERLALEFADARSAVAYTRVGVCNTAYGTVGTYATDLLNIAGGRLGALGGAMFPTPAVDLARMARLLGADGHGRWRSRVRGLPETVGELPASVLAEEIETAGPGQVRALITWAGNPALTTPNGRRLAAALERLEFMVSIDLYVNETARYADVILPPAWNLTDDHFEVFFPNFSVRNVVRWSPPAVPRGAGDRADWEILLELAERLGGGVTGTPWMDRVIRLGRRFGLRWNPTATYGLALRLGPHGDHFVPGSRGLNLRKVMAAPHGIDLGPLEPGVSRRVFHRDGRVHLAPAPIVADLDRLAQTLASPPNRAHLLLTGRRELRTNNSWMHNVPALVAGRERCLLFVHPADAARAGVADGETAILENHVHRGEVRVQLTHDILPGVVSLPHGWGHAASTPWQRVAGSHPGVSINDWTDDQLVEGVVGQSVLNGVPVRLRAKPAAAPDTDAHASERIQ